MSRRLLAALPQPDFLRPARREGGLAWLACASALLVLGVASADAWAAWQAHQQAQDSLLHSQRQADERARTRRAAKPGQAASASTASPSVAGAWLQRLERPWPAIWAASEAASEAGSIGGIAWQSLDLRDNGQLRLQGQAAAAGSALEAGRLLRGQAQAGRSVWRDVVVARIDQQRTGQQFEIQASLNSPVQAAGSGDRPAPAPGATDPRSARPARP